MVRHEASSSEHDDKLDAAAADARELRCPSKRVSAAAAVDDELRAGVGTEQLH